MLPRFSFCLCCCLMVLSLGGTLPEKAQKAPAPTEAVLRQEETLTYTEEIPFEVIYTEEPLLCKNEEVVITVGSPGLVSRTETVVYENGEETSRTTVTETVLELPTPQYVLRGTGEDQDSARTQPVIGDGFIITPEGQVLTFSHSEQFHATAYTHTDAGCDTITATGTTVQHGTVAVDPDLIPYFTRMYIVSNDGSYIYGQSRAEDCGGAIQGNRIDLYFPTTYECFQFGRRDCTVYFLTD